ncbi:MAG: hypothetical protein AAGD00_05305 [Planctomycetota bacterium]
MTPSVWIILNAAATGALLTLTFRARAAYTALTLATFPLLAGTISLAWRASSADAEWLLPAAWLPVGGAWTVCAVSLTVLLVRTRRRPDPPIAALPICTTLVLALFVLVGRIARLDAQLLALAGLLVYWHGARAETLPAYRNSGAWAAFALLATTAAASGVALFAASASTPEHLVWLATPWLSVFLIPVWRASEEHRGARTFWLFAQTAGLGLGLGASAHIAAIVRSTLAQTPTSHPLEALQVIGFALAQDPAMPGIGRLATTVFVIGLGTAVALLASGSRSRLTRAVGALVLIASVIAGYAWGSAPM